MDSSESLSWQDYDKPGKRWRLLKEQLKTHHLSFPLVEFGHAKWRLFLQPSILNQEKHEA
jgi:hypothetical protein